MYLPTKADLCQKEIEKRQKPTKCPKQFFHQKKTSNLSKSDDNENEDRRSSPGRGVREPNKIELNCGTVVILLKP